MLALALLALQASAARADSRASAMDKAHARVEDALQFDTRTLKARGYSEDLARYFGKAPRFLPGTHEIWIRVNAGRSQRVRARFDDQGGLCFDPPLLERLGLRHDPAQPDCADAAARWPAMRLHAYPGQYRVELTLPDSAFDPARRKGAYQRGGTALLFNYELFGQRIATPQGGYDYLQATLEPGLNLANWALRNRGVLTRMNGIRRFQQQEAYAQRPIHVWKALLQVGQINGFGTQFGGLPMRGAQIGADDNQNATGELLVPIQGIARSRATLEIRQRGRVVHRSILAPGPFALSHVPGLNAGADIDVTIIEEDGQRQRFSAPAQIGAGGARPASSWSLGLGRYRNPAAVDLPGPRPASELLTAEYAHNASDALHLAHAALLSRGHRSLATVARLSLDNGAWASAGIRHADTRGHGRGLEFSVQGSANPHPNLSVSLSWLRRGRNYLDADTAFAPYEARRYLMRLRQSLGASLSWAHPRWGALSYVASRNRYHNDNAGAGLSHTLSLNRKIGRVNASLSWQTNPVAGSTVYLNLSMPLGRGTLQGSVQRTAQDTLETTASYIGAFGRDSRYTLERSGNARDRRYGASVNTRTAYAQLGAGASRTTSRTSSTYFSAAGGLAYAEGLLGTSSERIGDTYALIRVPGQSGLRIQAPGGSAITNHAGTAVIPRIAPYTRAKLRLDTRDLPRNIRLDTTQLELGLARGSVAVNRIGAMQVRQLLLDIRDAEGRPVPLGASVYNEAGRILGPIVGDGNFMLVNEDIGKRIRIGGSRPCVVSYEVPKRFDSDGAYEVAQARCR
ncbi:fimbrial biogenesis outer membrane usher protein [Achromobacter sp. Marseille-Q0513]|uniref:fimbria/pilus outer membrane usher protein n=1 Tax=Achromobacter sp. Marseille-Q0513 TaxID=2829161 RepID=UPI001B8DB07E|nr:fimbria/pilus outer membrane usher protein [Achromobacter sp. Marseille-Q0513]MBR8655919.1 fimbrial biogenesis outer membrane usher protein [Achromobacter sp. Marseille-Q0513]